MDIRNFAMTLLFQESMINDCRKERNNDFYFKKISSY